MGQQRVRELLEARVVRPGGLAAEDEVVEEDQVPAVQGGSLPLDPDPGAITRGVRLEGLHLGAPREGAGPREDGGLGVDAKTVLDEAGIAMALQRRQHRDLHAEPLQGRGQRRVLLPGSLDVDRHALEVRELARRELRPGSPQQRPPSGS